MSSTRPHRKAPRILILTAALLLSGGCGQSGAPTNKQSSDAAGSPQASSFKVPIFYRTLDNGLKVVVSPDATAPTATIAVYYKVGLRTEPKGLTGFSHLFEHMMFQGSANLPKGGFDQLISGNGGVIQGQTKPDTTLYYEVIPVNVIEPVLWAEADRMGRLTVNQENLDNQREVVKNEYRMKIQNQPYAEFISVRINETAYENWQNGHNFWGDMEDLDAATLETVKEFHDVYYAPNNAVIVVTGDVDPDQVFAMVEKYFAGFEARPQPTPPDLSEPKQTAEKRASFVDPLAPQPALAFAYHMPERGTPEYYAMGMIDEILLNGQDSRLYRRLVAEKGYSSFVGGGINLQGGMFDYDGPMIWAGYLVHDQSQDPEAIVADFDEVIEELREQAVDQATLDRAMTKFRSGFYETQGSRFGISRADLLASFALFDDDPSKINQIEANMAAVSPELIQQVAREYLRPENRSLLFLEAGAATQQSDQGQ
ncbi:MAG: pitrilysin family protein [Gammaproteobacteria bacterium]